MRRAFTMIELIFGIILIAILATVAIPKLMATREDAKAARTLENINTIRKEVWEYAHAKGRVEDNFSKMSDTAKLLEDMELAEEIKEGDKLDLRIKVVRDEDYCVQFELYETTDPTTGNRITELNLSKNENNKGSACKIVQEKAYAVDYPITLLGVSISY
ncbi:MAG: type II secretion system protein [Campylobacterales bacterium]|jgi:general secretion pathway protein G